MRNLICTIFFSFSLCLFLQAQASKYATDDVFIEINGDSTLMENCILNIFYLEDENMMVVEFFAQPYVRYRFSGGFHLTPSGVQNAFFIRNLNLKTGEQENPSLISLKSIRFLDYRSSMKPSRSYSLTNFFDSFNDKPLNRIDEAFDLMTIKP